MAHKKTPSSSLGQSADKENRIRTIEAGLTLSFRLIFSPFTCPTQLLTFYRDIPIMRFVLVFCGLLASATSLDFGTLDEHRVNGEIFHFQ